MCNKQRRTEFSDLACALDGSLSPSGRRPVTGSRVGAGEAAARDVSLPPPGNCFPSVFGPKGFLFSEAQAAVGNVAVPEEVRSPAP